MCAAVNTTWCNTSVTAADNIRRVFYRQPCLVCVLAKRNKGSKLIWSCKKPATPPPPQQPPQSPKPPATIEDIPSDTKTSSTVSEPTQTTDDRDDSQWAIGECISYDNVGPISPENIDDYRQFIAFRDTRSKYLFCYPVKTCNEETFLNRVIRFFTTRGFRPRVLRSDYYTTFRSAKANQFYEDNQCKHESSAPYQ